MTRTLKLARIKSYGDISWIISTLVWIEQVRLKCLTTPTHPEPVHIEQHALNIKIPHSIQQTYQVNICIYPHGYT
uniref:Uncharacterized protein n=1 Tax=Arundo donax TaxID=35708 RepID=A0A0A9BDY3_ARUDO